MTAIERRTERLPAWSADHLAAIVDSSDDAIIGKTLDGTILSWNPGAEHIYGYTADEAVGRPISIIVPEERPDEIPGILARLRRGERIDHYQTVRVRKGGERIKVSVTISPVRDGEGRIIGASAIARDVSEQQRAVEAALRLREEFIAIAAHELRAPLATVYARLQLAERRIARGDVDLATIHRDVTLVREATDRLRTLIERLLDTSRISAGRLALERADTDVTGLVTTVTDAFAETSGRRIIVRAPDAGSTRARIDAVRFEEVLTNLLDNAVKYDGSGGPIEVDVTADDGRVSVAVRDRGPGIPPDQRERIFEPFRRLDQGGAGVGLGLHVAREIVRLHGGTVAVEAPDGGGARFVVTLPKEPEPAEAQADADEEAAATR